MDLHRVDFLFMHMRIYCVFKCVHMLISVVFPFIWLHMTYVFHGSLWFVSWFMVLIYIFVFFFALNSLNVFNYLLYILQVKWVKSHHLSIQFRQIHFWDWRESGWENPLSAHLPSQGLFPKCQKEKKGITLNVQNNKGKSKSCLLNFKGLISNNLKETISPPPQGGFGCTLFLSTFCTKFRFSPQHQMQSLVVLNSSEAF